MNDEYFMNIALQLATSVKGQTYPNPPVGAVIVKDGIIRGLGAHLQRGDAHAEVYALNMAGDYAKGATIYVTLEPCSHYGRTPPCAQLIIERKVARVVIANKDPNEKVAGKGIKLLLKAGLEVKVGILEQEATSINEIYFHYIKTGRPYITLKAGVSLDGKTATRIGESKWITGNASRLDVHRYRHTTDAILVGVNTIIADNPKLTTRLPYGGKNPIRIVLDTHLRIPKESKVVTDGLAKTIIFTGKSVSQQNISSFKMLKHVEIIQLQTETIRIEDVIRILGEKEITSLFVEGGATINDSFLQSGFINEYIIYIAPKLIGGLRAPTAIGGKGLAKLSEALQLKITNVEKIGDDVKIVAKRM